MTSDEIIELARAQGLPETETEGVFRVNIDDLGRILAAEREACAKVCDEREEIFRKYYTKGLPALCASAIRARGENK